MCCSPKIIELQANVQTILQAIAEMAATMSNKKVWTQCNNSNPEETDKMKTKSNILQVSQPFIRNVAEGLCCVRTCSSGIAGIVTGLDLLFITALVLTLRVKQCH